MDQDSFKPAPVKAEISFADVDRIDVRVGTILSVEDIGGSDKLLKLTVDFGDHRRSILAGMKKSASIPARSKANKRCSWLTSSRRK